MTGGKFQGNGLQCCLRGACIGDGQQELIDQGEGVYVSEYAGVEKGIVTHY